MAFERDGTGRRIRRKRRRRLAKRAIARNKRLVPANKAMGVSGG